MTFLIFVFTGIVAISTCVFAEHKTARLLVNIESEASFSPEEFAEASSAYLAKVDSRNPFKDLTQIFLDHDFIVLSVPVEKKMLRSLGSRFGYRAVSFLQGNLPLALAKTTEFLQKNPKRSSEIERIPKEEGPIFYDLLKKVDRVFTEHQITYWATGGTLLGAIRSQGIIPWDDDMDICVLDSDEEKIIALQGELAKDGLGLYYHKEKNFYKIFNLNGAFIKNVKGTEAFRPYRYPFVDIFIMTLAPRKEVEDIYVYKSSYFFWLFPDETFTYSQIQGIHRIPFGPSMIPVTSEAEEWCDRIYGISSDHHFWKKYALEPTWCHRSEHCSEYSGASFVELDDFSPVPWE